MFHFSLKKLTSNVKFATFYAKWDILDLPGIIKKNSFSPLRM